MAEKWNWVGPASGIAAAVLFIVSREFGGFHLSGGLDVRPEDSSELIGTAFADNPDGLRVGAHLGFLSAFFLLFFIADLRRRLESAEGRNIWLGMVAFGGGLIWIGVLMMQNSISLAARVVGIEAVNPEVARTLLVLHWSGSDLLGTPLAALILATSLVGIKSNLMPAWFAWAGVVITGLIVAYFLVPFESPLWMSTGLALLWVLLLSVLLLWQSTWGEAVQERSDVEPAVGAD